MKMNERTVAISSATTTENQSPFTPKNSGRMRIAPSSKTSVRRNEIIAEVTPSFSAVKKPEPKIANPIKKKDSPKMRKPDSVNCIRPSS